MLSEPRAVDWSRRTEPEDLTEWMDEPCSRDDLRNCLADLESVNRLSLGHRPTLAFLDTLVTDPVPQPLRILDVGFGGGGMLQRIAHWAARNGVAVQLTGVDLNPVTGALAKERYGDGSIQWLTGDAFAYVGDVDVVLSSLLTHHLPTAEVIRFLQWMEAKAQVGWFVNDLQRSARAATMFGALAGVMRWHRFVRHDGPVSFARSFSPADWLGMLTEAGIAPGAATVAEAFPARLCVSRVR